MENCSAEAKSDLVRPPRPMRKSRLLAAALSTAGLVIAAGPCEYKADTLIQEPLQGDVVSSGIDWLPLDAGDWFGFVDEGWK